MAERRAVIYTRISQDREGQELGVQRQEQDCRELCERLGWDVVEVLSDNDISASTYSKKKRPGWEQVLNGLEAGTYNALAAYSSSRMYRRLSDLMVLIELAGTSHKQARRDIEIQTVVSGEIDVSTTDGRMTAFIKAAVDQAEAERTSERIRAKWKQKAVAGEPHIRGRRYGYDEEMKPIPEHRAVVREMAQRLLNGESLNSICRDLNRRGERTATGDTWEGQGIRSVLSSPTIIGYRSHRGDLYKGTWEPILDEPSFHAVQEIFAKNKRETPTRSGRHLLTGLAFCGECQGPLTHNGANGVYLCSSYNRVDREDVPHPHGRPSAKNEALEAYVVEQASLRAVRQVYVVGAPASEADAETMRLREEIVNKRTRLTELYTEGDISKPEYEKKKAALEDQERRVLGQLSGPAPKGPAVYVPDPPDVRAALEVRIKRVILLPNRAVGQRKVRRVGNAVRHRVEIVWRDEVEQISDTPQGILAAELTDRNPNRPKGMRGRPPRDTGGQVVDRTDQCTVTSSTGGRCTRPAFCKTLCQGHYSRWRRSGDVAADDPLRGPGTRKGRSPYVNRCARPRCPKPPTRWADGLRVCEKHYKRFQRTGTFGD